MEGTIRQRGAASWEIQIFLGRDANGKRIRRTETVRGRKADAQRRVREILTELDRGVTPAKTKYKVGEWLDRWLDEKRTDGVREKTYDRYEGIIRLHLKPKIGSVLLEKLSPLQIRDLEVDLIKGGMNPKGVEQVHNVLDAALEQALRMELVGRNPAALVAPPKCPKKEAFVPEVAQVKALLSEARRSGHPLWPSAHVAAYTGVRRGEVAGLTWENVDLDNDCLSVVQSLVVTAHGVKLEPPKSKSGRRDIELDSDTVNILREYRGQQRCLAKSLGTGPSEIVFPRLGRTGWCRPTVLARVVARWATRAGCPELTLHSLRHFHASMLLQSGLNPAVVAERLGHSSAAITLSIYAHCLPGWQRGAADAFSNLMREAA